MTYSKNTHALTLKDQLERQLQNTLPKSRLKAYALPACPALKLFLFDPAVMEGPITHEEAHQIVAAPAYWSFCWASGQVLAAHILKHPELVQHKTVLDFGCGSGVVAVASAMAGATKVIACDLDSDALLAAQANAALNNVELELATDFLAERSVQLDLITAADVLYDADNLPLLSAFRSASPRVLLADSRIKTFPDPAYALMTTIEGRTYPDLNEFEEFNQVRIYQV